MGDKEILEKIKTNEFLSKKKFYQSLGMSLADADVKALYHTTNLFIVE